jgi:GT2 family glycosyltransferase
MNQPGIAIVILNFNGKVFLEKFLPNILKHSAPHPIYVADNGSTDDSIAFLLSTHPEVHIIQNQANYGYAGGYNMALQSVKAEYYVLLNSDVEVTPGWIKPVIHLMEADPTIAACQPKLLDAENRHKFEYAGAAGGFIDKYCYPFCRGRIFNALETDQAQYNESLEVFWASGACLFVRADLFWKVGGLDEDYFAHMEEIDLCWRLKNIGYKIYAEPASIIFHVGGGTLNKFSSRKTFLNFRNNLITLTKNHPSKYLIAKIVYRILLDGVAGFKFLFGGEPKHFFAVIRAHFSYYAMLPDTLSKRKKLQKLQNFSYSLRKVYDGNIVYEHFVTKKNKFSDLKRAFLNK